MGGIKILNLVIPKPDIPKDIASNYKAVSGRNAYKYKIKKC